MSLLQSVRKLEAVYARASGFIARKAMEEIYREFANMSDDELTALIAKLDAKPRDPELERRVAAMNDDELYAYIYKED